MKPHLNRRQFVKSTLCASAAISWPGRSNAGESFKDKLNHASFGASGMAKQDIQTLLRTGGINLVAVAEVDDMRAQWLRAEHADTRIYKDWRVLFEKEGHHLDSVNVTTPDHTHASIGVTAMKMGLHVYGQKPLAHNLYETRRMSEIARETGVVTQMGIQMASSINDRLTVEVIRQGAIGKIESIHMFSDKAWGDNQPRPARVDAVPATLDWDLWCGGAPKPEYLGQGYYHPGNWRRRLDYGCGTLGDMGCHIFNPMFRVLDAKPPIRVVSLGDPATEHNWGENGRYTYTFRGNGLTSGKTLEVHWHGGSHRVPEELRKALGRHGDYMPKQGSLFVGTDGMVLKPHQRKPMLFPQSQFDDFVFPELDQRDHYVDFVSAASGAAVRPIADFADYGGPLTEVVLLGMLSSRFPGQDLEWDADSLRVTNLEQANTYIKRPNRSGWEVEGL
ncbi:Gfo/Idh/MocA family protein [Algisphaera agarilytica]|uniref:Putative dehydrogenase n=1 Tax=Algisphaera agarilytica TaxID=1385975 RepID=A0A7X0H6Z5_9BACT|nr:Gfo/Idh/MocA family oxidoreductase [Algisphaera agarilytica]MBB6430422.1 putative dehydrogenase [Algisphaera agarilytica]